MNVENEESSGEATTSSELLYGGDRELMLREKYKCTAGDNGGWCDGIANGLRMRCPEFSLCKDRTRICKIGIDRGMNYV
jgi:hypothetical protein